MQAKTSLPEPIIGCLFFCCRWQLSSSLFFSRSEMLKNLLGGGTPRSDATSTRATQPSAEVASPSRPAPSFAAGNHGLANAAMELLAQHRTEQAEEELARPNVRDEPGSFEARAALAAQQQMEQNNPRRGRRSTVKPLNKEFSGYVSVSNIIDQVDEAHFEAQDGMHFLVAENAFKFRFRRQVRRSLLMTLGIDKDDNIDPNLLDVYSKSSNKDTRMAFLSLIVGIGTLSLPRAIFHAGVIPGLGMLCGLSLLNHYICERIVETPQFMEYNFENLIQAAGLLSGGYMVRLVTLVSIISWLTPCVLFFNFTGSQAAEMIDTVNNNLNATWFPREIKEPANWLITHKETANLGALGVVGTCFVIFVINAKTVKNIRRSSKVAWTSMLLVGILTIAASAYRFARDEFITQNNEIVGHIKLWADDWIGILDGVRNMFLAFGGVVIIPYIVAEMHGPEESRKVISEGVRIISTYYILVGLLGYVCWADVWARPPMNDPPLPADLMPALPLPFMMTRIAAYIPDLETWEEITYVVSGQFCHFFLFLKAVATIPIVLWPMMREFKFLFAYHEDPASELQLPWATVREKRRRTAWRMLICVIVLALVWFLQVFDETTDIRALVVTLMDILPTVFMSLFLPALISLFAIWRHWYLLVERLMRKDQIDTHKKKTSSCSCIMRTPVNATTVRYSGGSYCTHFASAILAMLVILFFLVLAGESIVKVVMKVDSNAQYTVAIYSTAIAFLGCAFYYLLGTG